LPGDAACCDERLSGLQNIQKAKQIKNASEMEIGTFCATKYYHKADTAIQRFCPWLQYL